MASNSEKLAFVNRIAMMVVEHCSLIEQYARHYGSLVMMMLRQRASVLMLLMSRGHPRFSILSFSPSYFVKLLFWYSRA